MITLERVTKRYDGTPVVEALSLAIPPHAFCVLIGGSGSGKSTTLRMINRLIEPSEGRILLDGQDTAGIPDLRLRMGYSIQSTGLFPHWTIARNIATVPALLGWNRARRQARTAELMDLLGLDPALAARHPHELSGGQQQRVGVARALAADPEILLMDEPFGALDPPTRAALQAEMRRIHATTGKTIIFVTHDMEEALNLATFIAILDRGHLVQADTPRALLAAPANDFVRNFVGGGEAGLRLLALDTVEGRMRPPDGVTPAVAVTPQTSLRTALALMAEHGAQALAVREPDGTARGTLHLQDLLADAPPA